VSGVRREGGGDVVGASASSFLPGRVTAGRGGRAVLGPRVTVFCCLVFLGGARWVWLFCGRFGGGLVV